MTGTGLNIIQGPKQGGMMTRQKHKRKGDLRLDSILNRPRSSISGPGGFSRRTTYCRSDRGASLARNQQIHLHAPVV